MAKKILLADDSVTIQKVVELTFAETDYRVIAVSSGTELLEKLPQERPDIVLCDVVMPDISGYEICQKLKSDPATLHIPVVLLTGTFEPFDRDRALAAGCDAIVTKPFEARAIIATVEELTAAAVSPAVPAEDEMLGVGVPEGVPALDFTTTGFDRMVPPPEKPPQIPEHGLELTTSSLQSAITPPPPPPPELAPSPGMTAPPAAQSQDMVAEPFPGGPGEVVSSSPVVSTPEEQAPAEPFWVHAEPAPVPSEEPPAVAPATEEEVETVPPGAFPATHELEAAPAVTPMVSEDLVQRVVAEVLKQLPSVPANPPAGELSDADVERVARKVLELATPILERVAWEVIPDLAEMLVRQRIAELEAMAEEA